MKSKTCITIVLLLFITPALIGLFAGCSASAEKVSKKQTPQNTTEVKSEAEDIKSHKIKQHMQRSCDLIKEQRYEEAKTELDKMLAIDPSDEHVIATKIALEQFLKYSQQQPTHDTGFVGNVVSSDSDITDEFIATYEWRGAGGMGGGMNGYADNRTTPALQKTPVLGRLFTNRSAVSSNHFYAMEDIEDYGIALPQELIHISTDEIWVIIKPQAQQQAAEEQAGCGAMMIEQDGKENIPLPLKHTDVTADIAGYIASVDVTQQFHNPYDEKIEAVYVFPLPQNAAVHDFIMTIGDRKIRGIIRERQEAEQIYAQARAQGHVASLLTQERPNIFTQKVANIEPGKNIDVNIRYFNTLAYVDGWYEFVFPMVVGPRFNPPHTTDGIGAVAKGSTGTSAQTTEVQYLSPNQRSGHDISLSVDIHAGTAIENIRCVSHVIKEKSQQADSTTVTLSDLDSIPNKDFVLRYKVAGDSIKSAFMTHSDKNGNYFTMMLYPPAELSSLQRAPMEMIFVLDCSGSMIGIPLETAKNAIRRALKKLQPNDTFQIIRFSSNASTLGEKPVAATPENIRKGLDYLDSLQGGGGTMMIEGIKAALDFEHDPGRLRLVSFMTDGYIGNEAEILVAIHEKLGTARIFSFGVGSSVNRYLLDRMAKLGKGAVAYIGLQENSAEIIDLFYNRISHPALTDITIDWGSFEASDVYPSTIPDLFAGRPVILTGRFNGQPGRHVIVNGNVAGADQQIKIPIPEDASTHEGIAAVWARKKIERLASRMTYENNAELPAEIKEIALQYGLMSAYTAFVAVDSSQITEGDHGVTVAVPVPVPEGVRYDTTVIK